MIFRFNVTLRSSDDQTDRYRLLDRLDDLDKHLEEAVADAQYYKSQYEASRIEVDRLKVAAAETPPTDSI